jgi:hypothetical protein
MIREIRRGVYPARTPDAAKNLERFRRLMAQAQKANIKIPKDVDIDALIDEINDDRQ